MSEAAELAAVKEELAGLKEALGKASGQTSSFAQASSQAARQIGNGVTGFATAMADGKQGASAFNGVINSAGSALGTMLKELGPLGTAFSKLTDFAGVYLVRANQQSDALFKSFQDLSKVGGAGVEGMKGVFNNMQQFGLTMDQLPEFGAMIAQNSEALAVMGGSVSEGTKKFAGIAAGIQQSGLQSEFERMGLKVKDINEGTASYLRMQTLTGMSAQKSQAALTAGAAEYIAQQDKLSRLTGKSAEALSKEAEARQSNERFAAVTLELQMKAAAARASGDEAGAQAAEAQLRQNEETLDRLPASMKQGFQDLMTGMVTTPEAQKMFVSLPKAAQDVMSQQAKTGEQFEASMEALSAEAKSAAERNVGLAKAGVSEKAGASFSGLIAAGKMPTGAAARKVKEDQDTQRKGGGDVDVNNQVAMRQAQRATTMALDELVNKGVGPVTEQMKNLSVGIESVITAIPGLNPKIATAARPGESNSGRGENTPATAGYKTNFKIEDFTTFLEKTVNKAFKSLSAPAIPPVTTSRQAQEVLTRASSPRQTGSMATMSNEQTNNILQRAAGPNTNYRTNLGDTTPATERTASTMQESAAGGGADFTQGLMTLAQNSGFQTSSMNELVELMRRSNVIQDRILQQTRN
jgi:tetrahydromethanopterin S-methyltransferase subunit B